MWWRHALRGWKLKLNLVDHIYACLLSSLVNRQKQWKKDEVDRIANLPDPDLPEGHRKMANEERKETLTKLQDSKCHPARQSDQSPMTLLYRSFHVYQHVTSFSNLRAHWLAERTNAVGFRTQNMFNAWAKTLEYSSKYTNILNPNVREDRPGVRWQLWQIVRFVLGSKKPQNELSRAAVWKKLLTWRAGFVLVTKYLFIWDYIK